MTRPAMTSGTPGVTGRIIPRKEKGADPGRAGAVGRSRSSGRRTAAVVQPACQYDAHMTRPATRRRGRPRSTHGVNGQRTNPDDSFVTVQVDAAAKQAM